MLEISVYLRREKVRFCCFKTCFSTKYWMNLFCVFHYYYFFLLKICLVNSFFVELFNLKKKLGKLVFWPSSQSKKKFAETKLCRLNKHKQFVKMILKKLQHNKFVGPNILFIQNSKCHFKLFSVILMSSLGYRKLSVWIRPNRIFSKIPHTVDTKSLNQCG